MRLVPHKCLYVIILKCAIIDDEPWAVKLLRAYVERTPSLLLSGTYASGIEAVAELQTNPVDLIFCDIQMPELDGIHVARMLSSQHSKVIFTTAFDKYALEGWKVEARDYLLKPIAYPDFLAAVQKGLKWFGRESLDATETTDSFFVKSDYKLIRVRFADILFVEGLKDYVKIYFADGRKPLMSLTSMRAIETTLPASQFLRTHRSFIVNMNQVNVLDRGQIVFDDKLIPVSDSYKEAVTQYFNQRLLSGRSAEK